ncbi:hypothetical protein V502_06835 [Pseudogymnoascus sp. VKM F-4520 (FW-2644)]|nr:hypothetical protein V502_06835 [Pseudogymnoascus sp. VKM F-4520 (FW-2644)]
MAQSKGKRRASNGGLTSKPGVVGAVARFWQKTYAPDYVGLAALIAAYVVLEFNTTPFHRLFELSNINIAYPHAEHERVPVSMMFLYGGGVPLIVLAIWLAISRAGFHKSHVTILSFFIGMLLTAVITDLIKNAVGRPRPDLIARCKAKEGTPLHTLVSWEVCTETEHHLLHDGWRSFPSGHSSFSFSGLGFLALFLSGQMHVFRREGDLTRGILALLPLLLAGWVAISRCEDYRHDVYDVTIGSALGMTIAHWSYRRFYPRLRNVNCDSPYASRSVASGGGFSKVGDDEEAAVMHDGTGPSAFNLGEIDSGDSS